MTFEQEPDYKYLRNLFLIALQNTGGKMDFCYDWDNRINDENLYLQNSLSNNNAVIQNNSQNNFVPNNEKIFNDDNTLKENYNNQFQIALQNNIYTRNEINESGIEPFPMDTIDNNDNMFPNDNSGIKKGPPIPNRRLKSGNCECCSVM